MSAWYWFDRESATKIDPKIQRGLFLFAVSNSCINPIVYGMFTTAYRREKHRFSLWLKYKLGLSGTSYGSTHSCSARLM
ncbi:hypothetical protein ACOMHN_029519 [Nucella lapillus]